MSIRLSSLFCCLFLILIIFENGALPLRPKYELEYAEDTTASTSKKTTSYRKLLNVTELCLREVEDDFLNSTKKLIEDVQRHTRSLGNIIFPNSTITTNVISIPKLDASRIYSAVKTLKDDLWTFKTFELHLRSNLSLIENSILDFSVDPNANLDKDYHTSSEDDGINDEEETMPCFDGLCSNQEKRKSKDNLNEPYVRTKPRLFFSRVKILSQLIEDGLRDKCRNLERDTLKFVFVLEDIVRNLKTSSSLPWKQPSDTEFDEILRTVYTLKQLITDRMKSLKNSLQSKLRDIEDTVENVTCAQLSDDSSAIEAIKSSTPKKIVSVFSSNLENSE